MAGDNRTERYCPRCRRETVHWRRRKAMPGAGPWFLLPLWPARAAWAALLNWSQGYWRCKDCGFVE